MDEVCDRCVVLKGLPVNCSENTVNEVLELAHEDFRFADKYEKLCTYKPTEDDVRWIVLFKTARDAQLCIKSGKWQCNTEVGRHEVIPDLCSDCIIPDEWILNEDWVITNSPKENDGFSEPLSKVDAADPIVTVVHGCSSDSASISGENAPLDESTERLQGAVGGSNDSTAFEHPYVDEDTVRSRKRDVRKLPPLPPKQTPCTPLNPMQDTDLTQTRHLFGSGQQDSISPSQCLGHEDFFDSDQKPHYNRDSGENNLLKKSLESADEDTRYVQEPTQANNPYERLQDDNKPSKSFNSFEMFGSGYTGRKCDVSHFVDETVSREECDEQSFRFLSDEAVLKGTYTKQADKHDSRSTSSLQPYTTNAISIEEQHCQNNDDSGDRNEKMEQNDASKVCNQNDANETLEQNDANKNLEQNDANKNSKQNDSNKNSEESDENENMEQNDANENVEQHDACENLKQNDANKNSEETYSNKSSEQSDANENQEENDANENQEENYEIREHTDTNKHVQQHNTNPKLEQNHTSQKLDENRADVKLDSPSQKKEDVKAENVTSNMQNANYQTVGFPHRPMPVQAMYHHGNMTNEHFQYQPQPGQYFPYQMPYLMMIPPTVNTGENNTENASVVVNPEYVYSHMPYQFPLIRPPVYTNPQQAYPMMTPYHPQANLLYDTPRPVARPRRNKEPDYGQRLQEGQAKTEQGTQDIYDKVEPGVIPIHEPPISTSKSQINAKIKKERVKVDVPSVPQRDNNTRVRRQSSHSSADNEDYGEEANTNINTDYESLSSAIDVMGNEEHMYDEIDAPAYGQSSDVRQSQAHRREIKRPPIPTPRKTTRNKTVTGVDDTTKSTGGGSALPIYDSSGNDERKATRSTVVVKGLADEISQEMLELFFENKTRSGGGDIRDVKINKKKREAIISFCNENDASAVLNRVRTGDSFVLSEVKLDVCEYIPSLLDPSMLFVTNIAESTSEECIRNFVEAKIQTETEHLVFGETPGTAMLYFKSPPDVRTLQQRCKVRPCDGAYLNISTVERTKSVKVTGMKQETSNEALGLYFENIRRSKGGDVEDVRCRLNIKGDTEYVVTFVKFEDAERVCKNPEHSLDGRKLTVCLHYPCMELDEDSVLVIPKPVTFDKVDKYVLKFIRLSQYYHRLVEENVADVHGKVVWNNADECLVVECIVDPNDRDGRSKVKDWTVSCEEVVKKIFGEIVIEETKRVACEVFEDLKFRLLDIDVANPDQVSVFLDKEECYITMVGNSDSVKTLAEEIRVFVDQSERKIYDENQVITKKRKLLVSQMTLLRATKLDVKLKASTSILEIDYENRTCIFQGRQKDVDNGLEELKKTLQSFVSNPVSEFPKQCIELTFKKETRDYVKSKFYKERLIGVWHISRSKEVFMNGRTEREVRKASDIFIKSFAVTVLNLDSGQADILSSQEGQGMIKDLERKHEGIVQFDTQLQQLTIISIDKIHEEVKAEFDKLFDVHTVVKEFLPSETGRLEFMKKFQRINLSMIEEQYQRLNVQISIVDHEAKFGFLVTGKKDGCKLALGKLRNMLDSVQCKIITKSWPGLDVYLSTDEGANCIRGIEVKEKCVVKVMAEKIKKEPSDEKRGLTNETTRKITIQVVTGSLVDEKVDVVVNSTNRYIDLNVGMVSRTLLKAGGDQLEADCKKRYPTGINVGELAITNAGGSLKCRALFHGLLAKWDQGQGQSQTIMEQFIDRCLTEADRAKFKSIAFPALGTGALGFPADVVAKTMFGIVKNFETTRPNTTIKDVHFVVWVGDQTTVKAFEYEYALSLGIPHSSGNKRASRYNYVQSDTRTNVFDSGSGYTTVIDRVAVSVVHGDLTQAKTDAIVNSTINELNLDSGNISKAILHAAGSSIQTEANLNKQLFLDEGLVVTSAGKLYCQKIMHVRARNSERGWTDTVVTTLATVEKLGLSSVAFPALGTGGKGFQPETMAKCMVQALQKFRSKNSGLGCLKSIQIIIYDPTMVDKFIKGVKDTIEPSPRKSGLRFWHSKSETTAKVKMQVYAESGYVLEKVATKIDGIRLQETIMFSAKAVESLDDKKSGDLLALRQTFGVDVEISNGRVAITGFGRNANIAVNLARRYVEKIESDAKNSNTDTTVPLPKGWLKMTSKELFKAVTLKPKEAEFVSVITKFVAETRLPIANVIKIERIQNTTLYTQYVSKKRQMEALGGINVMQNLWHGTSHAVVDKINMYGFNRNYNSGASHGVGVYFAVNASMSVRGYCQPDATGYKHIYLADVLTGDYAVGSQGIRVPPLNPKAPSRTCDSTTDNVQNPNFFVIFHDAQAYPAYHITFK